MASAYSAASSQPVIAATPSVTATVRTELQGAAQVQALASANPNNGSSINAILATKQPDAQQIPQQQQQQTTNNQSNQSNQSNYNYLNSENRNFLGSPT
jgi:hypothetical protein